MGSHGTVITPTRKPHNSTHTFGNTSSSCSSKARSKAGSYKPPDESHHSGKKGKLVEKGVHSDARSCSGYSQVSRMDSSSFVKQAIKDSESYKSGSVVGVTDIGLQKSVVDEQVNHHSGKKGKLVEKGLDSDAGSCSGYSQASRMDSNCLMKQAIKDFESCNSGSVVGVTDIGLYKSGFDEQVNNNQCGSQSGVTYCSSPQNSYYSADQFSEPEDNSEISQNYEVNKTGKVSSYYRGSTGSDYSDVSSSSSSSSAMYKPHKGNDVRWIAIGKARSHYGELNLKHFRVMNQLGCGDIGKVYLAELVGTGTYFAMKVMNKSDLESRKKLLRAHTEREILQSLDHPFLPTLYTHFETENRSFLVMEVCPGGDLHSLRRRQSHKCFPEHAARFYVAEVLLALEYLHMLGVIYRDLKPENVLVREDGHIMLSDFDLSLRCPVRPTLVTASIQPSCIVQPACFGPLFLSKKTKKSKHKSQPKLYAQGPPLLELLAEPTTARSMSFVGTHEYLAPEIIKGEGHGSAVDWWTFGIFLYELLFGRTPFKGQGNRATLFNVVGQPLAFPEYPCVSFAARDLIRGLLVKDPQHRLGYRRGATEIKQHPFFQSINWALIRCSTPPDVPRPLVSAGEKEKAPPVKQIDFF